MDFRTACRTAAEAGLRYIDVRKVGGVFSHEMPRAGWPELAGVMADHNLRLGAVQSNFGKCPISGPQYDEHVRFFPILVEQAHFFGTDVIRVFPFWNEVKFDPEALPRRGCVPTSCRRCRRSCAASGRLRTWPAGRGCAWDRAGALHLQREPAGGGPYRGGRGQPHVGVAWDVNNGWDEATVDEAYALFRGRVVNVHVKERVLSPRAAPGPRAGRAPAPPAAGPPGQRGPPLAEVIQTLERDGYRGLYSIETHFGSRGRWAGPSCGRGRPTICTPCGSCWRRRRRPSARLSWSPRWRFLRATPEPSRSGQ